jgi:tetratricopeptide (TPR) repeat protein
MPHPTITHNDEKAQGKWNTDTIRDLLTDAFSDGELTDLCCDHFESVYNSFATGMSKAQKIQLLIDYCVRRNQLEKLAQEIKEHNPNMYLAMVYRRGVSAHRKGKLPEARRAFQEVLDIDPNYQDIAQLMDALKQQLEATYQKGISAGKEHKLLEALGAFQQVTDTDPDYKDVAHLLDQVTALEKRRQVIRFLQASAVVAIVALVVMAVVLWPRASLIPSPATPSPRPGVSLSDTHVSFSITLGSGVETPVSAGHTLTLAPGDVVLIETSIMTDNSLFPRALLFQYYSPEGRVPAKVSGPRTSYIAPAQPGPDVIAVLITDQATHDAILRHINVIVREKE